MVTSLIERSSNSRSENGRRRSGCRQVGRKSAPFWSVLAVAAIALLSSGSSPSWGVAANDDYYGENYDDANYNYAANDDANNGDDYYSNNANGDDAYYANGDDGNQNGDDNVQNGDDNVQNDDASNGDDFYSYKSNGDDNFEQGYSAVDDDVFHWSPELGFEGVSVMPISCINYNNGHMIKFQLFDSAQSYQCHFAEISTFVVSIAHYMRAYFNYLALTEGQDFQLPEDAAYLNCIQLEENTLNDQPLYAKIGCMERETFTSTKLQLNVYTDPQCSQQYDDYQTARGHSRKGYQVGEDFISTKVSFKPPFYSCLTCSPAQVSGTFKKGGGNWYDDDYISEHGSRQNKNDANQDEKEEGNDDAAADQDDYYDDQYLAANDDVNRGDDANYNNQGDDGYYAAGDDYYGGGGRRLAASQEDIQAYEDEFWSEIEAIQSQRSLYDNYYNIGEWNMCQRIYKYGVWCDQECRSLDFFRRDQWSASDVLLLAIMTTFMTAMMLLVVAKRLKAQQRARVYGEGVPMPGLPPFAMVILFFVIMGVIITFAKLHFINETLVFAVVTCILLFIYMLKLTLFETRRPVLLAAPRHDMFDNPLDGKFIE